ncbi:hypothetical protein Bca52824_054144 [Brassica carinata]|uniref:Uncharacterized protein n=1 Tax=Brassica carinata TaxID=52824 RepID=A0A8X7RCZ5_BRACI|nr:hypothetical protein Bca52824_054144 [Brassica carinata]
MRGSGIVAMEWRVAVQRHDGVEVRRNWIVTWLVIKAITVQRWHKSFGVIGVITLLYVVSSTSNNGFHGVIEHQSARLGEGNSARGAKRLASTIVTPSRIDHMEENVTKRAKELTPSLSFTNLSDHEPVTVPADNKIIGALNDMDIEDNQDDGMMESEGIDEDLLGIDLKEMEASEAQQAVSMATTGPATSEPDTKGLKSSRQGTKVNVPLGFLSKKIEILCRGSPRKSSSSSQEAHMARDSSRSRKHYQSSKKQRGGVSKGVSKDHREVNPTRHRASGQGPSNSPNGELN